MAVEKAAPAAVHTVRLGRAELDILDAQGTRCRLQEEKPDWVVNAAAYTAVDLAEDHAAQAIAANATAVATLAEVSAQIGGRLLHLSTDFVFDGATSRAYLPGDRPNPLSVYGSSKLAGELHVLAQPAGLVLRTSWVYASAGKNFVLTMLRLMREEARLSVVCDQIGAPTWAGGLAEVIWGCMEANVNGGVFHWCDLGVASWYDFAVAIQEEALCRGLLTREVTITPISSAQFPTRAERPAFSVLDTTATRSALAAPAHHWRQNLRVMLDELRAA
jgi:dTDP-4-dehydrorhamnose reductase